MEPLRWKYRIDIDVEETENRARARGFSVRPLEGQAAGKYRAEYPLGQIEIKDGELKTMNTNIVVGPHVTQVYKRDREIADIERIESILREIVVPAKDETKVFGKLAREEVPTIGGLELRQELISGILRLQEEEEVELKRRLAQARLNLKGEELRNRLDEVWKEEKDKISRRLQTWVKQGIPGAEERLDKFNEKVAVLNRWDAEVASAKTPEEKFEVTMKHRRELDREICDRSES